MIATEILAFPSKSSRNKNDGDPVNEKTTPIRGITGVISIANSNDNDHFFMAIFTAVRPSLSNPVVQYALLCTFLVLLLATVMGTFRGLAPGISFLTGLQTIDVQLSSKPQPVNYSRSLPPVP